LQAGGANSAAGHVEGSARTAHYCATPLELVLDEANNRLFSTCYANNTAGHNAGAVKYFRTDSDEGYTFLRFGGANTNGTVGFGGTSRIRRAYSMTKHPNLDILYVGDLEICQITAASYGDTFSYYNGAISLAANQSRTITSNAGCGNTVNRLYSDTTSRTRPYSLAIKMNGVNFEGLFISNYNEHNVVFLNTSNASVDVGGRSFAVGNFNYVFGNAVADRVRIHPTATNSRVRNPLGVYADATHLYIADRENFSIARMDHSVANGEANELIGSSGIGGYDGEIQGPSNDMRLNTPMALNYSFDNHTLYFDDSLNFRIRRINLSNGVMNTIVGRGQSGNSSTNPEISTEAWITSNRGLFFNDDSNGLFYTDTRFDTGVNRNCLVRFFNSFNASQTILDISIPQNRVATVAGNWSLGCNIWDGSYENQPATLARLYGPWGIVSNNQGDQLYISSNLAHCIHQVDSSGNISTAAGLCGTAADASGAAGFARFNRPGDITLDPDPVYSIHANFFIMDRTQQTGSFIKYMNNSPSNVTIAGVTIGPGEIGKVNPLAIQFGSGIAAFEDQICYGQGSGPTDNYHVNEHTVVCFNRNTGIPTFRAGRPSAGVVKGGISHWLEDESISAGNALIAEPFGLSFDKDGNLYISLPSAHNIKKVARWW
jgi:hypothetical protein